jgi:hypothetical protein
VIGAKEIVSRRERWKEKGKVIEESFSFTTES